MQALIQRSVWLRVSETISTINEAPIYFQRGIGPVPRHVSTDRRILVSTGWLGKSLPSSMGMSRQAYVVGTLPRAYLLVYLAHRRAHKHTKSTY